MLQRAASNAYSWWWGSHIRTKQSKWLEENLHDMEVKFEHTLKIIDDDGDSFTKRVEMFYRKRPELINFVKDAFRSYRALAERYDHLSRELQSANRTIATAYPERVQYALDDDYENGSNQASTSSSDPNKFSESNRNIPKVPKMKKELRSPSMLITKDARVEHNRIKDILAKYEALEFEFVPNKKDESEPFRRETDSKSFEEQVDSISLSKKKELQNIRTKIRKSLDLSSKALTVSEFAEKIDEVVHLVVTLETTAVSLTMLINRLRSEVDDLEECMCSLEENKESLIESSQYMNKQLEDFKKMNVVKSLNRVFEDQTSHLQTQFREAQGNIDKLSSKLQDVKQDDENESTRLFKVVKAIPDAKSESELEEQTNISASDDKLDGVTEITEEPVQQEEAEKHDLSDTIKSNVNVEPHETESEKEGLPNGRHVFQKGFEDREKVLLDEYTSVLQDYKEVKSKLNEVENKNKDSIFDLAMQIRELKYNIATKDDEIKCLQQKYKYPQTNLNESPYTCSTEHKYTDAHVPKECITRAETPAYSEITQVGNLDPESKSELGDHILSQENLKSLPGKEEQKGTRKKKVARPHSVINIGDKIRSDIDELVGENLEFWLRFSTSIHQIQKFQSSIVDLQLELSKVKASKKYLEGINKPSLQSDILPIYRHMREIQTELDLWLEHSSLLKDELQNKFSSLCNIQEEISRISIASPIVEKTDLSEYKIAKFQGEVRNMKRENNKVINELQVGVNRMRKIKTEVEKTLVKLDEEFEISVSNRNYSPAANSSSRVRIPLRSFLFGSKLKKNKRSLLSCTLT